MHMLQEILFIFNPHANVQLMNVTYSYRRHLLLHHNPPSLRENVTLAAFQHKGVSDYILCIARM